MTTDYGGKYLKIRKAVYTAGFDEFYQAGSENQFHKMNIVAESAALGLQFWIHIDGGYGVSDTFSVTAKKLGAESPSECTYYKNQQGIVDRISAIRRQIEAAKAMEK